MGLHDKINQDALQKLRTATIHASAAQKMALRDYQKAKAQADEWAQRYYQLATQTNQDDLARQAKFQKERYEAIASRLKKLVNEQTSQVATIKDKLTYWDDQISEAQQLQVIVSGMGTDSAMAAFERMEEKVMMQEARFQSSVEAGVDLDTQFAQLEAFSDIDDELAALKAELFASPSQPQQTKTSQPNPQSQEVVDSDLESLSQQLDEM